MGGCCSPALTMPNGSEQFIPWKGKCPKEQDKEDPSPAASIPRLRGYTEGHWGWDIQRALLLPGIFQPLIATHPISKGFNSSFPLGQLHLKSRREHAYFRQTAPKHSNPFQHRFSGGC